jgi:hypothetical protein
MYTNLRAWLERGAIPDHERLAGDLTCLEYGYTADNAIQLERKEHLRSRGLPSTDWSDALALTFAEHVEPRDFPEYLNPDNFRPQRDYDRFAELEPSRGDYDRYADL